MTVPAVPWLVRPADRVLTPNRYHAGNQPGYVLPVELLVLHYTGGYGFEGSARWLANLVKDKAGNVVPAKASAHLIVGRGGEVVQLAPLTDRTWHAGGGSSRWRGKPVNGRSIGIEIANLGWLKRQPDGRILDAWGKAYTGPVFTEAAGGLWEPFPDAQLEAVAWLVSSLVGLFPVLALEDQAAGELPRICGHQDVDPTRKVDPGPAFPLELIRRHAQGRP